jgi:excisionase family DNA binding protein
MMSLKEAASEIRVCYNTMLKYVNTGAIKAVKIGRTYRVSEEEIERVKREGVQLSPETLTKDNI